MHFESHSHSHSLPHEFPTQQPLENLSPTLHFRTVRTLELHLTMTHRPKNVNLQNLKIEIGHEKFINLFLDTHIFIVAGSVLIEIE